MGRETLLDFFDDLARTRGEFLVHDDGFRTRRYSYEQVAGAAAAFAERLGAAGIARGDTVVFWSENRPEWIVAFWGCLAAGVIVVPVDYRASVDFVRRVGGIVSAKLAVVGQDVTPLSGDGNLLVWKLQDLMQEGMKDEGQGMKEGGRRKEEGERGAGRDDVAEIIFTSGATAEPKGVVITHRNILANIVPVEQEVRKYRKWGRPFFPLRFLDLLPLSHMFGQAMATFIPPMLPGTVIFTRSYNSVDITHQIKRRRISVLVSVPKMLEGLREHVLRVAPEAGQPGPKQHWIRRWWRYRRVHRLFGWKFWAFVVGAAPLDPELEAFWNELGFVVVQGYGLTETAPIVTLNHPFETEKGSVGKAIAGVDVKIAPDGEILVRGENVTRGYFNAAEETARAFEDGWFHTGDIGEIGPEGRLFIRGRKKEMIVTPEGLNVFPEDVERVLNHVPGVRDSAVVGMPLGGAERVHAVLVLEPGTDPDAVVREANTKLEEHQKIRRGLVWPEAALPRTEGTRKLKRAAIREWARTGATPAQAGAGAGSEMDPLRTLVAKYAGRDDLSPETTLDELGLSSLDRVELMVALEDTFQTRIDETAFSEARDLAGLRLLVQGPSPATYVSGAPPATSRSGVPPPAASGPAAARTAAPEAIEFPSWNRSWPARAIRRASLPTWILPLARVFAWMRVEGRQHLDRIDGPVIFASNHQSHLDTPVIMAALPRRWRYRLAPAMAKEFFRAHFFPAAHTRRAWFTNTLNYVLAALFFNGFPLPQRETGARQTLRYIGELLGDGWSVLIFPEGERSESDEIKRFRPGVGMIASKLGVPVVPVRLVGVNRVLHPSWRMARPGRVRVIFGEPLYLTGENYEALARQVEDRVRRVAH